MVALVHEFQSTLSPALLSMIQAVQSTDASADFQAIRLKEGGKSMRCVFACLCVLHLHVYIIGAWALA